LSDSAVASVPELNGLTALLIELNGFELEKRGRGLTGLGLKWGYSPDCQRLQSQMPSSSLKAALTVLSIVRKFIEFVAERSQAG
jgi:hypothetical protein